MKFDEKVLEKLEIKGLSDHEKQTLLAHMESTLNERIGVEIVKTLDDAQLDELMTLQEAGDDQAVQSWMEANIPELDDIIADEIDIVIGELAENADKLDQA